MTDNDALLQAILDRAGLGNGGVIALAGMDRRPDLQSLWLNQNRVGSMGLTALARSPHFPRLRSLELCHNQVTSSGVRALAQAPWARSLGELHLLGNRIDDRGAQAILDSPHLAEILTLTLAENRISPPMRKRLKRRFEDPNEEIQTSVRIEIQEAIGDLRPAVGEVVQVRGTLVEDLVVGEQGECHLLGERTS